METSSSPRIGPVPFSFFGLVKIGSSPLRRIRLVAIILLAILLVPYGFSRVASPWRRVAVHSLVESKPRQDERSTVRIACYNIAHGRGLAASNWRAGTEEERSSRLDRIADLLRALDADLTYPSTRPRSNQSRCA